LSFTAGFLLHYSKSCAWPKSAYYLCSNIYKNDFDFFSYAGSVEDIMFDSMKYEENESNQ